MPTSLLWFHQRGALVDAPFTWSGNIREHWERRRRRTFSPANACLDSDGEVWVSLNFHKDSWMRWCQSAESPKTATAPTTRGRRQNVQYPWKHWTLEKLFLDVFPVHTNVENIMIIHKKNLKTFYRKLFLLFNINLKHLSKFNKQLVSPAICGDVECLL